MSNYSIERNAKRHLAEQQFEATIREYIIDKGHNSFGDGRRFQFGGAHNFLATVHTTFEKLAKEFNCSDYEAVAVALQDVLNMADLPYRHAEEDEDGEVDQHERRLEMADRMNDERKCAS